MGLRGGIRASFHTISNMHHPLLNAIVRGRIPNKMQHGHRPPFLCNRICYYLRRILYLCTPTVCSDSHRTLSLTGAHPRVAGMRPSRDKTAMG